jgi:hypothetical protein
MLLQLSWEQLHLGHWKDVRLVEKNGGGLLIDVFFLHGAGPAARKASVSA